MAMRRLSRSRRPHRLFSTITPLSSEALLPAASASCSSKSPRPHTTDSPIKNSGYSFDEGGNDGVFRLHDFELESLQQQFDLRSPVSVRTVSTPPPWKPPWKASPRKAGSKPQDPQEPTGLLVPHRPAGDPPAVSSPRKSARMMSKVLKEMLPLADASTESAENASHNCERLSNGFRTSCSRWLGRSKSRRSTVLSAASIDVDRLIMENSTEIGEEIAAFRTSLSKSFGNLTRAFRAMKNAVTLRSNVASSDPSHSSQLPGRQLRLNRAEFEWCVSAYLHYGDCRLARRLFVALDQDSKGDIGLMELAQLPARKGLLSLVQFRRLLLDRHPSLPHAFREIEEYVENSRAKEVKHSQGRHLARGVRTVKLREFAEATAFFGLDARQASHFFHVMDVDNDGQLTLAEFLEALTHMPRKVLLHDLRQRLLLQYSSLSQAFRDLVVDGPQGQHMDATSFKIALARLGISDVEAAEVFKICDEDGSGAVSLDEFRDAVREIAPKVDVEGFWCRFAAEWPQVANAARARSALERQSAAAILVSLLPEDIRSAMPLSPRLGSDGEEAAPSSHSRRRSQTTAPGLSLLTVEGFHALAALLDISRPNAEEIFSCILASVSMHRRPHGSLDTAPLGDQPDEIAHEASSSTDLHVEDFLEQLNLWADNPVCKQAKEARRRDSRGAKPAAASGVVQTMLAPSKAAISAFKAELTPAAPKEPPPSAWVPSRRNGNPRRLPKLPWQHHAANPSLISAVPICV